MPGMTPQPGITTRGKVKRILDGDTVEIEVSYPVRVRLKDVWAPEKDTKAGQKVWAELTRKLIGEKVLLHIPTVDADNTSEAFTFGRVLGVVYVGSENINEWLVKEGYATKTKNGVLK